MTQPRKDTGLSSYFTIDGVGARPWASIPTNTTAATTPPNNVDSNDNTSHMNLHDAHTLYNIKTIHELQANPAIAQYYKTQRAGTYKNIYPHSATYFQPFGELMRFDGESYLNPRYVNLRDTPSVGYKKINNMDLYLHKTFKRNADVMRAVFDDYKHLDS